MGRIKKIVALGLVVISSMVFAGCNMIQKTPEAIKNETLAKVGDQKITRGEVEKVVEGSMYYQQLKQQYGDNLQNNEQAKSMLLQLQKSALESLVDQKVMITESEKNKWMSDEEINKKVDSELKEMKKGYKTEEEFKQAYEASGYKDENKLKENLKERVIVGNVIENHIYKDVKVTDADVKKYYDENKATTYTIKPGADVYQIIIADGKDAEKTIKKIREDIVSGKAKFADMAAKYNIDATKSTGGSLGYIDYDSQQYDKTFMAAMKKLKDGEISQPVKTQFGYHLIKVENVKSKAEVIPFDKVKDSIKQQLDQSKKNKAYTDTLKKWKDELGVKVYEDKIEQKN